MHTRYTQAYAACPATPATYAYNATTHGNCVKICPSGLFAQDSTRNCSATCPNYYFVNYTANETVRMCVATCPNNTFINGSANYCVLAISN